MRAHNYRSARTMVSRSHDWDNNASRRSEPETNVVQLAQLGDGAAFERIYRAHRSRIFGLCLRMVGNPTEAEDLMQDAFLQVFRKIQTFRGESAFSTWLYRLALNVVLMHMRKRKLRRASLGTAAQLEDSGGQEMEVGGPDLSLAGLIDRFRLEQAVDQLSPACKMVFVLHDIQGYKHREIAGMMASTIGTSKVRLHHARSRLRQLLLDGAPSLPRRPFDGPSPSAPQHLGTPNGALITRIV